MVEAMRHIARVLYLFRSLLFTYKDLVISIISDLKKYITATKVPACTAMS